MTRVLIAGLGNMGMSHALAHHKLGSEIVGLVNRSPVELPDALKPYPYFDDFSTALEKFFNDMAFIEIYTTLGLPRGEAVYAGSVIGVAFVISRGLATLWADRISTPQLAKIVYLALPLSFLPLLYVGLTEIAPPVWLAVGVSIAFGLPAGLVGVLRPTFPLYLFGTQGYGSILGRQARATELASAVSPAALSSLLALSATGAVGALAGVGAFALMGTWRVDRHTVDDPLKTA